MPKVKLDCGLFKGKGIEFRVKWYMFYSGDEGYYKRSDVVE